MKNNLNDLKDYLFATLDVLTNDSLDDSELEREAKRAKSITEVADKITNISRLQLDAIKTQYNMGQEVEVPDALMGIEDEK